MTREELDALVDEAHVMGRKVMCHVLGGTGLRMAVEAGVDSIEHGSYLNQDPKLLEMMARTGIYFAPTFSVFFYHAERGSPHESARALDFREHHAESLRLALEAGVQVVAGCDAGAFVHGNNAHELTCLVERRYDAHECDPGRHGPGGSVPRIGGLYWLREGWVEGGPHPCGGRPPRGCIHSGKGPRSLLGNEGWRCLRRSRPTDGVRRSER